MDAPEDLILEDIGGDELTVSTAIVDGMDGAPDERIAIIQGDGTEPFFNFDGPQLDTLIAKLVEVRAWIG